MGTGDHLLTFDAVIAAQAWTHECEGGCGSVVCQDPRLAERCDPQDTAAVAQLCLPWLTDADSLLKGERRSVRDTVLRLVSAYLLCVGAAASECAVPAGHWKALALPSWSQVAHDAMSSVGPDCESEDEVWLRDDVEDRRCGHVPPIHAPAHGGPMVPAADAAPPSLNRFDAEAEALD